MRLLKFLGSSVGFFIVVSVMINYYAPDSPPGRVVSDAWDGIDGAWDGIRRPGRVHAALTSARASSLGAGYKRHQPA